MQFQFLGTGGAFDVEWGNSAALFQLNGYGLLVDCGHSVYGALVQKGLVDAVTHVFLTHTHDDHCGSLGTLIYHHYFKLGRKLKLVVADDPHHEELHSLLRLTVRDLDKYLEFVRIQQTPGLTAIPTHGLHFPDMPTWGLFLEDSEDRILYSGDMGHPTFFRDWFTAQGKTPTLILHEATWGHAPGVHCHYTDLYPYLELCSVYIYHCPFDQMPEDCQLRHVLELPPARR